MKVHLMHADHDFRLDQELPVNAEDLIQDLGLAQLFQTMSQGDDFLLDVARKAVLGEISDVEVIQYRQDVLKDCLKMPQIVRDMYNIAVETIERRRKERFGIFTRTPSYNVYQSVHLLRISMDALMELRRFADCNLKQIHSRGFSTLFTMLQRELSDEYFARVHDHLRTLSFERGMLIRAQLGKGHLGTHYTLVKPSPRSRNWLGRMLDNRLHGYTIHIQARDETGARILSEIKDRGVNVVANVLAQSVEHILAFFNQLKTELAFYVGCLNLYDRLSSKGEPICFPAAVPAEKQEYSARGLYDVCLSLRIPQRVVGNDVDADGKNLWVITGANQGGKSTFLRSVGVAQLMMQCGMFVPAKSFCASICHGLFTHFRREEDAAMNQGKFDEELGRMSTIVDHIRENSLVLLNESFAATNEREGSEIARQIITGLVEHGVKVVFVTHLYEYAQGVYSQHPSNAVFLRAQREPDGTRSFRIQPGRPLSTSFGKDLYHEIFQRSVTNYV
ncbi:MAG: hypothetical protein K6T68_01690 [Alicyclobacillus shizuokensis]|nr:hypothetical protein [Alicyclobacillus shizuokensis]